MKKNRKCRLGLFTILITLSLIPLILSITFISITSLSITRNNMEESMRNSLYIVSSNLARYCCENEINAINVGNYYEYLDSLKDQDIEMAILLDGTPCATSIKNENEYRIREIGFDKNITEDKEEIENGYYEEEVVIDGKAYYAFYMPIKADGQIIGVAFAGKQQEFVTGATEKIAVLFAGAAVFPVVLFAIVILFFSKGLLKAFDAVGKSVNALSKGDLSRRKEQKSAVREMDDLLSETGQMQKNMAETIGKVKDVSQALTENIAEATKLSESSSGRARQITSAMEELTGMTVEMTQNVQDIHEQMSEMEGSINDISENVEHLFHSSENILRTNKEARADMHLIMENSRKSVGAVKEISTQIKETNASITQIDKAVELILNISGQTKLLSLNASIEAARAGEQGKGFAVVAEEIRTLSEQSTQGAEMIKNLAGTITEKSQRSVQLADSVSVLIGDEQESIAKTQKKYEELGSDIDQSVNETRSIAEKTGTLSSLKEKVIENIRRLSVISEKNSANNEEVTGNIGEILAEVHTVNENCENMSTLAEELERSAAYFHD